MMFSKINDDEVRRQISSGEFTTTEIINQLTEKLDEAYYELDAKNEQILEMTEQMDKMTINYHEVNLK